MLNIGEYLTQRPCRHDLVDPCLEPLVDDSLYNKKNIFMLSLKKRHEWLPLFPVIDRIDVLSDELGIHALSPHI